ncbi:MAG: LacI family DNA-binding transcriptional regulator [Micrococcales bacterium]|nr:LacI family DNA-binding transcriptional regulator [Micrococcales bacterium]
MSARWRPEREPVATVNLRDVATLAGVSVGSVSNVLNRPGTVSQDVSQRVLSAIDTLGYVRNDAARQLRAGRSRCIGLVVLDIANPFFSDLVRGAERRAAEENLTVLLGDTEEDPARERVYIDLFAEQRVYGLLVSPLGEAMPRLRALKKQGLSTVLMDWHTEDHQFSSVAVDNVAGGKLAVDHLLEMGRTRIAFAGGPHSIRQVSDRFEGARKAVAQHPGATLEVIDTQSLTVLQGREAGHRISQRKAAARPDAIFAANDLLALGVLQAFNLSGRISVPNDIALIGYDDIDFAAAAMVPLSSVKQPSTEIGHTAVDLLLREVAAGADFEPERIVFQPELVIRDSTSAQH